MNNKRVLFLIIMLLLILLFNFRIYASDVTPIYQYQYAPDPDMPQTLYVGNTLNCGNYSIRLLQQPVVSKYINNTIADNDLEYLTLRIALKNISGKTLGWLNAESFKVIETYKGRMYSMYNLDIPASAAAADNSTKKVFFDKIDPGETIFISLVFNVYPDVDGWILQFAPRVFYEESPLETISFLLPKALWYSEVN